MKYIGVIIDKGLKFKKQVDSIRQKTDRKMNTLKVVWTFSGVNTGVLTNIYTATAQSTMEYGAVTFGGRRCILGAPRRTSAAMMRQELQFLPVLHRA